MFLDKELDVICLLQAELKHSEPLLYKSNSFCKKVSRYIKSINSFSDNSGHLRSSRTSMSAFAVSAASISALRMP